MIPPGVGRVALTSLPRGLTLVKPFLLNPRGILSVLVRRVGRVGKFRFRVVVVFLRRHKFLILMTSGLFPGVRRLTQFRDPHVSCFLAGGHWERC